MNADKFVIELFETAPSVERLRAIGLSEIESDNFRAGYVCVPRILPQPVTSSNVLIDLARRWDLSRIEVGMVRFLEKPRDCRAGFTQIGTVEVDPLFIEPNSSLIVEDSDAPGKCLWRVARSPSQFLDALVRASKFLSERAIGTVNFENNGVAIEAAKECATFAGGEDYIDFYNMLLCCE